MAALLSTSTRVALRSGASASFKAGAAGLTFARGKATLPDLSCKRWCLGVFGISLVEYKLQKLLN
jgi:hypothetical protein